MKKQGKSRVGRLCAMLLSVMMLLLGTVPVFADPPIKHETQAEPAPPPEIEGAEYIYLYNFENNRVLIETDNHGDMLYPASTVKIMTGIVVIEALGEDRHRTVTITEEMLERTADTCDFKVGEVVNAEQLLYAMLVNSSNNAAVILAGMVAESKEDFVEMMNEKARELGAYSTVYMNPTGLHNDAMVTTLSDTATIAKYAYENPYFMEIVSTDKYQMAATNLSGERRFHNTNWLISRYSTASYYYDRAIGMNAGSTSQAGYCSVTVARNPEGTLTYLCVIMNAERFMDEETGIADTVSFSGAVKLFNWVMNAYGYRDIMTGGNIVCELPVGLSATSDYVTLVSETTVSAYLPMTVDIKNDVRIVKVTDEDVKAPVSKGQRLGYAKVIYGGVEIGRTELIATSDIERSEFLHTLSRISAVTDSVAFKATVISAIALTVIYVLVQARFRQQRLRSRVPRNYRR